MKKQFVIDNFLNIILVSFFVVAAITLGVTSQVASRHQANEMNSEQQDWRLRLVNREHLSNYEPNHVVQVDQILVDQRIAKQTKAFVKAAKKISPDVHLISGYRSIAQQKQLFNRYVDLEMSGAPGAIHPGQKTNREQAIKLVMTYSQPPHSSEHQTGLAIDLSDQNELNTSEVAPLIQKIAPKYGFVLRFPPNKTAKTGIDYEDWHYRYVGVKRAKEMTEKHLTLEEYLAQ